jgi:hypothetical protein
VYERLGFVEKFKGVELLRQGVTSVGGIDNTGTNDPDGVRALGNTQADAFQGHQFSLWALGMSGGAQRLRALNELGYCRVGMIGSNIIFRPMARAGFASGWVTMRERDKQVFLSGPHRHLVRLRARLDPSTILALPR